MVNTIMVPEMMRYILPWQPVMDVPNSVIRYLLKCIHPAKFSAAFVFDLDQIVLNIFCLSYMYTREFFAANIFTVVKS